MASESTVYVVHWTALNAGTPGWVLYGIYASERAARAAVDLWAREPRLDRERLGLPFGMPWLFAAGYSWAISPPSPHHHARTWTVQACPVQGEPSADADTADVAMVADLDREP